MGQNFFLRYHFDAQLEYVGGSFMRNDVDCEGMYEMFLMSLSSFILKPCVKNYETDFFKTVYLLFDCLTIFSQQFYLIIPIFSQ